MIVIRRRWNAVRAFIQDIERRADMIEHALQIKRGGNCPSFRVIVIGMRH